MVKILKEILKFQLDKFVRVRLICGIVNAKIDFYNFSPGEDSSNFLSSIVLQIKPDT